MNTIHRTWGLLALMAPAIGLSQTALPLADQDLINLTTPHVLPAHVNLADAELQMFGGDDGLFRGGFAIRHGFGIGLEVDGKADFAPWGTDGNVRFAGSDGEVTFKYALPKIKSASLQAGVAYMDTPAQFRRFATVFGGTIGKQFGDLGSVYLNPRGVLLKDNGLVGLGVGLEAKVVTGIHLIGEWTPLIAGNNAVDPGTGSTVRTQLYGAAIRFSNSIKGSVLDLGYTNASGQTTGMGLTPGIGNAGALYARLTTQF